VPIANNGGANSVAVSEHALLLMLAVSRRLITQHANVAGGRWRGNRAPVVRELRGRTLGIVGLGTIGKKTARLAAAFGISRTKRILLLADFLSAAEAAACGFLTEVAPADRLDARVTAICESLIAHAPITMRTAREALRRIVVGGLADDSDLLRAAYGSEDFRTGVAAFLDKSRPRFEGT
jgi:phosphoglycerate dehydrogenase-like enzyme